VSDPDLPLWLRPLAAAVRTVDASDLSRFQPPSEGGRPSAVLILLGEDHADGVGDGPDVLLIQRATTLRSHAGQPAFPGGAMDTDDVSAAAAALREAVEETGLDPAGVHVVHELPRLYLPASDFVVTPVLAWWRHPSAVRPVDVAEVAGVARVPLAELADPGHRYRVRHPSGVIGPAFGVRDMVVWGFTAGLLDRVLTLGGFAVPWDESDVREVAWTGPVQPPVGSVEPSSR
jgi:8-oxo-dGTP pyrophosphatase MutT (NUDIX family)